MAEEKSLSLPQASHVNYADTPLSDNDNVAVPRQRSRRQRTQLERYLSLKPITAFGLTLQSSWEGIAISFQATLLNGGPAALTYGFIVTTLGSCALALSLGEMASLDPTVGAQYRWTARHCPRRLNPKFWGLMQGWLTWLAWIAACALTPFFMGTLIQALIIFNNPSYVPERWHTTLLTWACIWFPVLLNVYARRLLAPLEIVGAVCHLLFFICNVVTLGVLARRSSNEFVWKTLIHDQSGWTNPGAAFCIGLLSPTFVLSGFDGILHMSDEVKDAPKKVPRSMVLAVSINAVFAFAFIVCLLYTLGDYEKVLGSPTGLPIIETYYEATKSVKGTNVFMAMLFIDSMVGNFNVIASVSRLTWAFSQDRGLPFSDFFSHVHPRLKIPTNALGLVLVLCSLLALINIGSTTAFSAVLSLTTLSLYISYIPPILFFLIRKLRGRTIRGPFHLGRWGIPVNIFALMWGIFMIIWLPFPVSLPVTKETMNYAAPVWIACVLIALVHWFVSGRKTFEVPVGIESDELEEAERTEKEKSAA